MILNGNPRKVYDYKEMIAVMLDFLQLLLRHTVLQLELAETEAFAKKLDVFLGGSLNVHPRHSANCQLIDLSHRAHSSIKRFYISSGALD